MILHRYLGEVIFRNSQKVFFPNFETTTENCTETGKYTETVKHEIDLNHLVVS